MRLLGAAVILIAGYFGYDLTDGSGKSSRSSQPSSPPPVHQTDSRPAPGTTVSTASILESAYANQQSDLQVTGEGIVTRVLPDDNEGSRHQKFILRVTPELTVLVSHNIDLAPRIPGISVGDRVGFNGEYEWNDRGGVIHWTHHDPGGRHIDGWLEYKGKKYQ